MTPVRMLMLAAAVALGTTSAMAQPVTSAKSGVVAYLEGKVFLDNERLEYSTTHFPQIKENSILRTDDGRVEVLLTPGVVLRMGENASLKMLTTRLIDTRLELLTGSAVIEADSVGKETAVTVVCKNAVAGLEKMGIYRFDADPGRLKVFKGQADVKLGKEAVEPIFVSGGKMLGLAGDTASVEKFNIEEMDALDRWSSQRGMVLAMANPSAAKTASSRPTVNIGMGMGTCNVWVWNPWFGVYTWVPCNGSVMSPYGYRYWSPYTVGDFYYRPPAVNPGIGAGGFGSTPYNTSSASSIGSSGTVNTSTSVSSSSSSSMGSTSSSSAASSSAGHGSSGGSSGHGH